MESPSFLVELSERMLFLIFFLFALYFSKDMCHIFKLPEASDPRKHLKIHFMLHWPGKPFQIILGERTQDRNEKTQSWGTL